MYSGIYIKYFWEDAKGTTWKQIYILLDSSGLLLKTKNSAFNRSQSIERLPDAWKTQANI